MQEEAVCANKRVLVCRDTTERPETIDCGLGKLIDTQITENIEFRTRFPARTAACAKSGEGRGTGADPIGKGRRRLLVCSSREVRALAVCLVLEELRPAHA